MRIVKIEKLPSTVNGWGFNGATNKVRYTCENGDIWVAGTAHFRHIPSERYIQMSHDPEFTGGLTAEYDRICRGKAENHIANYYKS